MKQRVSASAESVRKPERLSDAFRKTEHAMRRTIPAHPMSIIQQRPRDESGLWSNPADWYAAEWWRIRGAYLFAQEYFAGFAGARFARDKRS
jgi:hypothetical protein